MEWGKGTGEGVSPSLPREIYFKYEKRNSDN